MPRGRAPPRETRDDPASRIAADILTRERSRSRTPRRGSSLSRESSSAGEGPASRESSANPPRSISRHRPHWDREPPRPTIRRTQSGDLLRRGTQQSVLSPEARQLLERRREQQRAGRKRIHEEQHVLQMQQAQLNKFIARDPHFRGLYAAYNKCGRQAWRFQRHFGDLEGRPPTVFIHGFDLIVKARIAAQKYHDYLWQLWSRGIYRHFPELEYKQVCRGLQDAKAMQGFLVRRFRRLSDSWPELYADLPLDETLLSVFHITNELLSHPNEYTHRVRECYLAIRRLPWPYQRWAYARSVRGIRRNISVRGLFERLYGADFTKALVAVAELVHGFTHESVVEDVRFFAWQVQDLDWESYHFAYTDDSAVKALFEEAEEPWPDLSPPSSTRSDRMSE